MQVSSPARIRFGLQGVQDLDPSDSRQVIAFVLFDLLQDAIHFRAHLPGQPVPWQKITGFVEVHPVPRVGKYRQLLLQEWEESIHLVQLHIAHDALVIRILFARHPDDLAAFEPEENLIVVNSHLGHRSHQYLLGRIERSLSPRHG